MEEGSRTPSPLDPWTPPPGSAPALEQSIGNVNVFGVSAMDNDTLLNGRPHGGCAMVYNKTLKAVVSPVETNNPRICAGNVKLSDSTTIIMFSVYMPCDTTYDRNNADLYDNVLQDIRNICNRYGHIDYVMVGGDLNTDIYRHNSLHTLSLSEYCNNDDLVCVTRTLHVDNEFTYESSTGSRSFFDHFLISDSLIHIFDGIDILHDGDNLSDHCPVVINLNMNTHHVDCNNIQFEPKPWKCAQEHHVTKYKNCLNDVLCNVSIPNACVCHTMKCHEHKNDIITYHSKIVEACNTAMNKCIPVNNGHRIVGWSEHVQPFKERSLLYTCVNMSGCKTGLTR